MGLVSREQMSKGTPREGRDSTSITQAYNFSGIMRAAVDTHQEDGKPLPGSVRVPSSAARFDPEPALRPTGASGNPSLNGHRTPHLNATGAAPRSCFRIIKRGQRRQSATVPDTATHSTLRERTSPVGERERQGGHFRPAIMCWCGPLDYTLDNSGRLPRGLDAPKLAL